jgi:hypothetical protein
MQIVYYNHIINGEVVEEHIPYPEVLEKTGLKDQVGLTERGWVEVLPVIEIPPITSEQLQAGIRRIRDDLLKASDWTQLPDNKLTTEQKAAWATYRQQLRDLPETYKDATQISDIIVPNQPT